MSILWKTRHAKWCGFGRWNRRWLMFSLGSRVNRRLMGQSHPFHNPILHWHLKKRSRSIWLVTRAGVLIPKSDLIMCSFKTSVHVGPLAVHVPYWGFWNCSNGYLGRTSCSGSGSNGDYEDDDDDGKRIGTQDIPEILKSTTTGMVLFPSNEDMGFENVFQMIPNHQLSCSNHKELKQNPKEICPKWLINVWYHMERSQIYTYIKILMISHTAMFPFVSPIGTSCWWSNWTAASWCSASQRRFEQQGKSLKPKQAQGSIFKTKPKSKSQKLAEPRREESPAGACALAKDEVVATFAESYKAIIRALPPCLWLDSDKHGEHSYTVTLDLDVSKSIVLVSWEFM